MMLAIVHLHCWQPHAVNAPRVNKCCFALCQHMEKPMELSQQFLSAVEEQYACLYLNSLGASNSEANMCVSQHAHRLGALSLPYLHPLPTYPAFCYVSCLFDFIIHDA